MLVLSRQRDESIIIGDNIVVTIVDVRGDKVKLGIEAPQNVSVHRREVYEAIRRENQHAAKLRPEDARGLGRPSTDRQRSGASAVHAAALSLRRASSCADCRVRRVGASSTSAFIRLWQNCGSKCYRYLKRPDSRVDISR